MHTITGRAPRSRSRRAQCPATAVLPVRLPVAITASLGPSNATLAYGGGHLRILASDPAGGPRTSVQSAANACQAAPEHLPWIRSHSHAVQGKGIPCAPHVA